MLIHMAQYIAGFDVLEHTKSLYLSLKSYELKDSLGGGHVHVHIAPTLKMDIFCFSFSSSSLLVVVRHLT